MTKLQWDRPEERLYELGIDRGVLYLPDGAAVPWNGLSSVEENFSEDSEPVYFDGNKILDIPGTTEYSAQLRALTYPDEFLPFDGFGEISPGFFSDTHRSDYFHISYRTGVGDPIQGRDRGYKIHVVYNLSAIPNDKAYDSQSNLVTLSELSWKLESVPGFYPGFAPTSHVIIDSTRANRFFLRDIEAILYGDSTQDASLPSFQDLMAYAVGAELIVITDHGDGSWTAEGPEELVYLTGLGEFQIDEVNATYLDPDTYEVSTTKP